MLEVAHVTLSIEQANNTDSQVGGEWTVEGSSNAGG